LCDPQATLLNSLELDERYRRGQPDHWAMSTTGPAAGGPKRDHFDVIIPQWPRLL